ncbi:hypothetical protein [Stenotrophomonas tuberculopleuritidis]|uniref:hypothetical protein n=1 Tax=Stenotrophomonas tuberculopleuritidis TaxID=3055079 RepID=UPI0026E5995F|nr:hypothetical protein [Stenotrophomonas sp. 704A1]
MAARYRIVDEARHRFDMHRLAARHQDPLARRPVRQSPGTSAWSEADKIDAESLQRRQTA